MLVISLKKIKTLDTQYKKINVWGLQTWWWYVIWSLFFDHTILVQLRQTCLRKKRRLRHMLKMISLPRTPPSCGFALWPHLLSTFIFPYLSDAQSFLIVILVESRRNIQLYFHNKLQREKPCLYLVWCWARRWHGAQIF